jgi:predicted alpha/beta-hydrolase family hydrolase
MTDEYKEFHTVADARQVSGFLHAPGEPNGDAVALTHGAGGNCRMPLLMTAAQALSAAGFTVLRYDLAFRRKRPTGPPSGSDAADRASIEAAAGVLRTMVGGRVILSGQSYGGRQSTMLAAERPEVADALLLFSYPLHPPGKADRMRTAHFPALRVPALFVQGTTDPFGSPEEIQSAIRLIPAPTALSLVEGAGHDLKRGKFDFETLVVQPLHRLFNRS